MTKVHEANQNYPFEQLSLANPHGIQGGAFFSKLLLNEEHPCLFQTPKCLTKNGIVRTGKKTYCDLIIAADNDTFLNFLQEFEKRIQQLIYEKRNMWFHNEMEMENIEYFFNPVLRTYKKQYVTRAYVREIADFIGPFKDIPAPDVYTDEQIMVWILDEYEHLKREHVPAVVTGKPVELGGIKARNYSTALGGIYVLEEAMKKEGMDKSDVSVAVQGFGNVGENAARILHERGYKIIAVSDSRGGIINREGLNIPDVIKHKKSAGRVEGFPGSESISNEDLLVSDCDVLVPAALSDQINGNNAGNIKAKIVLELANAPSTTEADIILFNRSVMVIPDVLANAGGVAGSYLEWIQNLNSDYWEHERVLDKMKSIMISAYDDVYAICQEEKTTMRKAAYKIAIKRILVAEKLRGNL